MQGDKVGEATGKVVLQRILPSEPWAPKMEINQRGAGTLLGVRIQETGTYESSLGPDGTVFGGGQGTYMGEGGEVATWTGHGVGTFTERGGVKFRGAVFVYSQSEAWSRLNSVACIFEYEVDADDNHSAQLWEWK